jgi:hypothetical protein
MVRRFLAATLRGYAFAFKNPQAAADMFIKRFPKSNRDLSFAQWSVSTEHVLTDRTRSNGLGYIDRPIRCSIRSTSSRSIRRSSRRLASTTFSGGEDGVFAGPSWWAKSEGCRGAPSRS